LLPGRLAWLLAHFRLELLAQWKKRVLEDPQVPDANRLTSPALEDHIPRLLEHLLQRLTRHPDTAWGERVGRVVGTSAEVGVAHAQQRFAVHYTLSEALRELSHLRAAVLDLCAAHAVAPNADEMTLLHSAIDEMMMTSATEIERADRRAYEQAMAVVAHDLRNPLNTIAVHAALMQNESRLFDPRNSGRVLAQSARIMGRLVEDLLAYAKLEAGHFSVHPADVDACDLVRETLDQYRHSASRRKIELSVGLPNRPTRIICDHDRILQALGNLVGNAIKFTPNGGRVRVELEPLEERCQFRVADSGPGIAPEHTEEVFRPFWQAPGAAVGAGLGLAIARGIVEAHGGEIGIERHAPAGACFVFTLPYDATPKKTASLTPNVDGPG
jgi:signal transduction histidine kinase